MEGTFILEPTTQVGYQFEHMGHRTGWRFSDQDPRQRDQGCGGGWENAIRLRPLTLALPPRCSIHPVNLNAHLRAPRHGGGVGNDQNCAHDI